MQQREINLKTGDLESLIQNRHKLVEKQKEERIKALNLIVEKENSYLNASAEPINIVNTVGFLCSTLATVTMATNSKIVGGATLVSLLATEIVCIKHAQKKHEAVLQKAINELYGYALEEDRKRELQQLENEPQNNPNYQMIRVPVYRRR